MITAFYVTASLLLSASLAAGFLAASAAAVTAAYVVLWTHIPWRLYMASVGSWQVMAHVPGIWKLALLSPINEEAEPERLQVTCVMQDGSHEQREMTLDEIEEALGKEVRDQIEEAHNNPDDNEDKEIDPEELERDQQTVWQRMMSAEDLESMRAYHWDNTVASDFCEYDTDEIQLDERYELDADYAMKTIPLHVEIPDADPEDE